MLRVYNLYLVCEINGNKYRRRKFGRTLIEEEEESLVEETSLSWNTLEEVTTKYNHLLPFVVEAQGKKGRVIKSYSDYSENKDIKEWKDSLFGTIRIKKEICEDIPFKDLIEFKAEDVIEYLKQRGL